MEYCVGYCKKKKKKKKWVDLNKVGRWGWWVAKTYIALQVSMKFYLIYVYCTQPYLTQANPSLLVDGYNLKKQEGGKK